MLKEIKQVRRDPSRWIKKVEHNIEFRVPGLSHSVVKEAEHIRVQEVAQRIESHPRRPGLQAELQQNNIYNPFSENSKEMIRELVSSCAKQHRKYNVPNVFFIGIKELCTALADNAWFTANPEENLTNYDWMQSLSRTTWSRKALPMVLDTARLKYKR